MMTCDQVVEHIDDFLMDLLEADVRDGVESHVRTCATCGQALEKARSTWAVLDEWQPKPPSAKSTRRGLPRPASPPWAPALALAGAILVMVALAIVYVGRRPSVVTEQRTAQVDVPPPAPPEKGTPVPTPERPRK